MMILIAFFAFLVSLSALFPSMCLLIEEPKFDVQNWQINVNGGVFVYMCYVCGLLWVQCRVTWEMVLDSYVQLGIEREREI